MRHFSSGASFEGRDVGRYSPTSGFERKHGSTLSWRSPLTSVLIAGAMLILLIGLVTGVLILDSRNRAILSKERELANVAMILADETDRAFQALELVQISLIEQLQAVAMASGADFQTALSAEEIHRLLNDKISGLPYVKTIVVTSPQGKVLNSSETWAAPKLEDRIELDLSAVNSSSGPSVFISEPSHDRGMPWTTNISRRLTGRLGEYLGLVIGGIDLAYFENFFGTISLEPTSSIALFRRDGVLLARYPHVESLIGRNFGATTLAVRLLEQSRTGVGRQRSIIDGEDRIIAAQAVEHYPIVITASTTTAAALADWQRQAEILSGSAVAGILVISAVIIFIYRELLKREHRTQARMWQQKRHLDNALDNMRHALLMFDSEGKLALCNRRFLEMYRLAADTVKPGCTLTDLLRLRKAAGTFKGDPDRYMDKLANAQGVFQGDPDRRLAKVFEAGKVETKVMELPDGRTISITNSSIPGGGWVSIHEDMTERRQIETERNSNQELLKFVLEHVPTPIFIKDALERRYVLVNRAGERFLGLEHSEIIGRTCYDVFPNREANCITTREYELLRSGRTLVDERLVETPRNGPRTVVASRIVLYDPRGVPYRIVVMVDDITERQRLDGPLCPDAGAVVVPSGARR